MWSNYFFNMQAKYDMRISTKNPLIIRFDGKNVTKNKEINLFYNYKNGFVDSLKQAAKYFSKKYNGYSLFGSDEISFIFPDPMPLLQDLDSDASNYANEIIALFSQYFFDFFNNVYKEEKIFWHGKCFSIPNGKITSYIKYRSGIIKNVMTTYFLIINKVDFKDLKLKERIEKCKEQTGYDDLGCTPNGYMFFNGNQIDLFEFYNGNIKAIQEENISNNGTATEEIEIEFLDF